MVPPSTSRREVPPVTNKPFYVVVGATTTGERNILGIRAGDGGEGAPGRNAVTATGSTS